MRTNEAFHPTITRPRHLHRRINPQPLYPIQLVAESIACYSAKTTTGVPMKRILRLMSCLLLVTATVATAETLTNDSVIQLHKLGLGDSTIVAKIKASTCQFDTSVDALKTLKDAGLSDEIIQAMLLVSTSPAPAPAPVAPLAVAPGDPNDPKA